MLSASFNANAASVISTMSVLFETTDSDNNSYKAEEKQAFHVLVIKRRDLSNKRNTSKSKTRTKLKPESDSEKKASVRDSYKAACPEKKQTVTY
ncbi:hypothetical protein EMCRGX_G028476 [Ephydatia muelleri]